MKFSKTIKAGNFYEFVKCPRKVYLHFFGNQEKKQPLSEFMQKKSDQGKEFEQKIIKSLEFIKPEEEFKEEQAFEQTLNYMKQGKDLIYQGWLMQDNLVGIPDLLEKKKGKSELGDYYYEVCDIKLGKSVREEYVMQIMFYSYLLFQIQGLMPKKAYLILGNKEKVGINVKEYFEKFQNMLEKIKEISQGAAPSIYINGSCKECVWKSLCLEEAKKENSLSLIYNLPRSKIELLKKHKIRNLKQAAKLDVEKLSEIKEFSPESLNKYKLQSKSLLNKEIIKIKDPKFPRDTPIYFDIEDTEDKDGNKIVYLFGLVINNEYINFLAKDPKDEKKIWNEFLKYFEHLDNFKLYTYSHHEKSMLKKLFIKHKGNEETYNKIQQNIIDLFKVVKETTVLPIYSYTIKDVAKFLGFRWTSQNASGSQSIVWYDQWLEKKNKKYLDEVLKYNEEDCKAMLIIKEHIEKQ